MSSSLITKSEIHPVSYKLSKQGHPWVTADTFTKRFVQSSFFIEGFSKARRAGVFLHDPKHQKIKARFWSQEKMASFQDFITEVSKRIQAALKKRTDRNIESQRENYYLVFGEADFLPGLFIQKLGGDIFIQYYSYYWLDQEKWLLKIIRESIEKQLKLSLKDQNIWRQFRAEKASDQKAPLCLDPTVKTKEILFKEFDITYQAYFGETYDIGIYTDMSSIREKLQKQFEKAKRVLNLFAYTGAFSLFALKNGAEEVVSVDLSKTYLDWLEKNIALNEFSGHQSLCTSALNALKNYAEQKRKFDFIICDPPSASSDGKKKSTAFTDYEKTLPLMLSLTDHGGHILIFLNTHQISKEKFKTKIQELLVTYSDFKIIQEFGLGADCLPLKNFSEGNYLKGILIKRASQSSN